MRETEVHQWHTVAWNLQPTNRPIAKWPSVILGGRGSVRSLLSAWLAGRLALPEWCNVV